MEARKKTSWVRGGPRRIDQVLSELMAQKGFGRVRGSETVGNAWREAVGEQAAQYTRPGTLRRGVLEVVVANSAMVQELVFQKADVLLSLKRLLPDTNIKDLRFHVASVDE